MMAGLLLLTLAAGGVAAASSRLSSGGTSVSSEALSSSASASVVVTAATLSVRVIVVDEAGAIREIWSNTPGPEYTLRVRLGHRAGPDLSATDDVLAQYASLVASVNWNVLGLVYSS